MANHRASLVRWSVPDGVAIASPHCVALPLIAASVMAATMVAGAMVDPPGDVAPAVAAYERGDFASALTILKPLVYESVPSDMFAPKTVWAKAYLAQMYRRGEGTPQDWALSCALFNDVWADRYQRGPGGVRPIPFVDEGIKEVCPTAVQEEVQALRSACFLDGVARREFVLDGGAWIVVDRRGFHLDLAGEHRDVGLSMMCNQVMVSLTEAEVSVPDGSSNRRVHFLELFKWISSRDPSNGHMVRELHWIVYTVKGVALGVASDQTVLTVIDGTYPSLEIPPGIRDAAVLRLNAAGDVEWLLKGSPRRRGLIPKP